MKIKNLFSGLALIGLFMSGSVLASGGLTGWYQSNGTSAQTYQSNYNSNYTQNYNANYNTNYNNVGIGNYNAYTQNNNNYRNPTGGGLTAYYGANNFNNAPVVNNYTPPAATLSDSRGGLTDYYAANNFPVPSITYQPPAPTLTNGNGGFTQYFSQNLQANTFAGQCNPVSQPNAATCQNGSYREIKNNYGCTIDWRCEGGNFCPVVSQPAASQCNGVWEAQYNVGTQCLTHYFCDRTPEIPTGTMQPVIESFNGPNNLEVNQSGTWTIRARSRQNEQLSYSIDWGETQYATSRSQMRRPTQQTTFTHQYANAGTYTVRITVSNQNGQQATSQTTVKVGGGSVSKPSISSFTGPTNLRVGETGTFNVVATHPIDKAVSFSINYGESNLSSQSRTSQIRRGSSQTFQHAFSQAGTYTVRVTATTDGQQDTKTLTVRVTGGTTGAAPVVRGISGPTTLTTGQTGTWRVQASDPNNGNLSYQINWGDEMYGAQSNYAGRDGYVQNSAFTHYYDQAGTYTVSVVIRNNSGQTARTSTTVRVGRDRVYQPESPTPYYSDYRDSYNNDGGNRHSIFNRSYGTR